ncbi:MAG: hypothetical protein ACK4WD_04185 [Flavobacteriales bacterium]|jgi:hypothetical protein
MSEIEISPTQNYRLEFINAINKYIGKQKKSTNPDYLYYQLSASFSHQSSCYSEKITCLLRIKTNRFNNKKTLHSFEYVDLLFLEKPDSNFDIKILDTLSILSTIYCNLNESFWNYKKDWSLIRKNISNNKDKITTVHSGSDYLRSFCLSREGLFWPLNQYKKARFLYHFKDDFTLTKISGISFGLINAYNRLLLGAKRFDINYTIEYSEFSGYYPSHISITNCLTSTDEYLLHIELSLLETRSNTSKFSKTNVLPINWPHSTKAWLKSQGIPVNTIE